MHRDRVAGSVCRRCGRPICPECMREAPVGWQCSRCVHEGQKVSPTVHWRPKSPGRLGSTRMTPTVIALIVVNVAVFIWQETNLTSSEQRFGLWPARVHYVHEYYRLLTNAFIHASAEHILFNMITLAIIAPAVEAEIGAVRFLAVYFLSALGGSVLFNVLAPSNELGLGASGAIFGVMGAYYVLARVRRWQVQTITSLLVINIIFSFVIPGIAWQAHLGGLVTGALVCLGLVAYPRSWGRPSEVVQVVQGISAVVIAVVALGLLSMLPVGHINV